ncbi:MAG: tetratricopeptide repeat protein [Acidobacteriota bacterium]
MPFDREETLKKAEKLLRQGRLEGAIAEYVRVVEKQPRDWNTANTLGDLYVRAGQLQKAAEQYSRVAEHFSRDGFYPKAAALYKKILKIRPDDESAQLQLADMSAKLGLLADAKAQLNGVAERRRQRGDRSGADEIVIRLGSLDPADFEARLNAARVLGEGGSTSLAAERYRQISADLMEKNREPEAMQALREAVRLNPADVGGRAQLARNYLTMGDLESAREFLDEETADQEPGLLLALASAELRKGRLTEADAFLTRALELDASVAREVTTLGWTLSESNPDAAFLCIDRASDVSIKKADFEGAASLLREYISRAAQQVPALLKLVEVCVDGGLESMMYETQGQLCDAYLGAGQASEARVIAEDLVAREPWEESHIERFRRALVLLKVPDPDTVIAERLNGQMPFVATDRFVEESGLASEPVVEPPAVAEEHREAVPPATLAESPVSLHPPEPTPPASPQPETGRREVDMAALHAMLREAEEGDVPTVTEVDLTSALFAEDEDASAHEAEPPAQSLDEVFARARDHSARQPGAEQAAEQLKLGRTCIEAGMFEEAVRALEEAVRSPRHRFEAAALLGRLYRDRHDSQAAIEWMERAAEAPARSADEGRALLYDLGVVLEDSKENARALAIYMEISADVGQYRDVQARIDRLSRVETES